MLNEVKRDFIAIHQEHREEQIKSSLISLKDRLDSMLLALDNKNVGYVEGEAVRAAATLHSIALEANTYRAVADTMKLVEK